MPRSAPAITRFNAGKLSKLISARIDQAMRPFYDAGAQVMTNWMPLVEGPMTKRPGFRYVKSTNPAIISSLLVPFQIANDSGIMLEFGASTTRPDYIRFYKDGAAILETAQTITSFSALAPAIIGIVGHGYSTGDEVFISGSSSSKINDRYFIITVLTPDTFSLDGSDGSDGGASGGTASRLYEIGGIGDDLSNLDYTQNQDSMYFTYANAGFPRELIRTDDTSWTFGPLAADWPPFEYDDTSGISIQASAATGTGITLTASSGLFSNSHVSRLIRLTDTGSGIGPLADGGGEGYVVVTSVGSSTPITTATADVVKELDPQVVSSPTTRWAWDAWNSANGGPDAVAFYDDRLWFAGSIYGPDQIWASRVGSYNDFSRLTSDEGGLHFDLKSGVDDAIVWMAPIDETLVVGTNRSEWTINSVDPGAAISAGNVKARVRSRHGSRRNVNTLTVDQRIVFAQRAGRKLRDFRYEVESNNNEANDLTRLARNVTSGKITELSYQQEPNRIVWVRMEDNSISALTYEYAEQVIAWSDITISGGGAVVASAVLPTVDSTSDELWLVVERTIDGNTVRYIEQSQPFWEDGDDVEDAFFFDSGLFYDGSPATSFVGADHLEGETVACFADGVQVDDVTITDGAFTLASAASKVLIGYEYTCQYLSMPIEAGAADGASQGKPGSIARIALRLDQTGEGLSYGVTLDDMRPVPLSEVPRGTAAPASGLLDGDSDELTMPMNQTRRRTIALQHTGALPCTVVGIFARLEAR